MSAWKCDNCTRGTVWADKDGRVSSYVCYVCRGTDSGWAPGLIALAVLFAACVAYAYVCNGCHV